MRLARVVTGIPALSRQVGDLQAAAPTITALAREYPFGFALPCDSHARGQLSYAVEGVMRVRTEDGMWIVPPLRALWIPADVEHETMMLSRVSMRTIYIRRSDSVQFGTACRLIEVGGLLRELIVALMHEPVEYTQEGRGGLIATLIMSEIAAAPSIPVEIPWPRDPRLLTMCKAIIDNPGQHRSLDDWADIVGASTRTLMRLFHRETGLHFRHWVQQVHLAEALTRLSQGESVSEVAYKLGYASPSAFTNMFRRILGQLPSHYLRTERLHR